MSTSAKKPHRVANRKAGIFGFRLGNRKLRGLLPTLSARFYPDYNQRKCKYGPVSVPIKKRTPGRIRGSRLGTLVDKQATKLAKLCAEFNVGADVFAGEKAPAKSLFGSKHRRPIKAWKEMHDYTRRLFRTLSAWKLKPIDAQVVVANADYNLATAVDMVCRRANGQIAVIELKTGFDRYLDRYCGQMRPPFAEQTDSARNQHQLQLAFGAQLYSSHIGESVTGYIIRIDRSRECVYPVAGWAMDGLAKGFNALR